MRIIARFEKSEEARYVSHLDVQRLFQRAMHRANLPMAYSQGFNPHPIVSFATALAVGYTSTSEWIDVKFAKNITEKEFIEKMNSALPVGFRVLKAENVADNAKSLTAIMKAAEYDVKASCDIENAMHDLLSGEIVVTKKTKSGMKEVDIRGDVHAVNFIGSTMHITGRLDAAGSLNIDLLMGALKEKTGKDFEYKVHRTNIIFDTEGK